MRFVVVAFFLVDAKSSVAVLFSSLVVSGGDPNNISFQLAYFK